MVIWHEEIQRFLSQSNDEILTNVYNELKNCKWKSKKSITPENIQNRYQRYLWDMRDNLIWIWAERILERFEHRPQSLWRCRAALGEAHWRECYEYLHNLLTSEYGHLFCEDYEGTLDEETEGDPDTEHEILWTLAHALATLRWVRLERRGKVERAVPDETTIATWLELYLNPPFVLIQMSLF